MQSWSDIASRQCKISNDKKGSKLNIQYNVESETSESKFDPIPRHKEIEAHPADDFEMTNRRSPFAPEKSPIPQYNDYDGFKYPAHQPSQRDIRRSDRISKYKEFMYLDEQNYLNPPYPLGKIGSMGICNNSAHTILLSGGFLDGYDVPKRKEYSHVIQYNVKYKKYTKHSTMLKPNHGHKMFKIKANIYIMGGRLKSNEIHIFKSGQKKTERKWISRKVNANFGKVDRWSERLLYVLKNNLIHVFHTGTGRHWTIDVLNDFVVTQIKECKLPSSDVVGYIQSIFNYKHKWYVIGRETSSDPKSWGVWYFDGGEIKQWIRKKVRFDFQEHSEWYRFEHVLYNGYLIMGNIVGQQGYAGYSSGIYDIENDIFVETRGPNNWSGPMVGLPLAAMILKDNKYYHRIYIFGGDETDTCGKFLQKKQYVIILREVPKDKMKLVDGYVMMQCLKENRRDTSIIPKSIILLIGKYVILNLI